MVRVEVCVESIESALTAQRESAYRVELCAGLSQGGITPPREMIAEVRKRLDIKLHSIIRPRGGDFVYSGPEFDAMRRDVAFCGAEGCDGVVIGMLRGDGSVDTARCRELAGLAHGYGMEVTFHRAFDEAADRARALEDIIAAGCGRVLTSGGAAAADEGIAELKSLVQQAAGRIVVMPGAGVTPENIGRIIAGTGCREIHGTFRRPGGGSLHTDTETLRAAIAAARKFR